MEVLSKSGLSENTMVLFTSDHGDLDDSHKLEHKTILYEEATNVPFIILYPWMKKKGIVDNEHLISNGLCLMPTLCEVAGIEASSGLAGSSVLSLIEQNRNTAWTKNIFLETETGYIIHTGRFKYELDDIGKIKGMPVDLKNDGETENLINRVEYKPVIDSLRYELINHLKGEGVRIPALASQ
jgi:choline-sulfatase